jgi:hypothetical protein
MTERLSRNYVPVDAVQLRTISPTYVVDSMSNWRRRGSSHELSILCDQIEEDIINGNVNTNRIKLNHRPNGEGGRWQP